MFRYFRVFLTLCVLLCPFGTVLRADVTATILGTAHDSSLAAMPRVKITASNAATNFVRTTTTDATGEYRFLSLPVGTYKIEAELAGFQKFVSDNIILTVDQQHRV